MAELPEVHEPLCLSTKCLPPPIPSKWRGLRGLVEQVRQRELEVRRELLDLLLQLLVLQGLELVEERHDHLVP